MQLLTYAQARDKVYVDLDLTNEVFTTEDEVVGLFNEAIDDAEAEICKINEDYFLTSASLTMVSAASTISLPSNIYANKMRALIYRNGADFYEITRIRDPKRFVEVEAVTNYGPSDFYRYFTRWDSTATGVQIQLVPAARVSGAYITVYYLRNANRIPLVAGGTQAATDATIIDVPEFVNFVMQFVKVRILEKEGGPRHEDSLAKLQQQRALMVETLTEMVPDNDTELPPDLTHYWEHA
jgi:hypothetical protein